MSIKDLIVTYKGVEVVLNSELLSAQDCWDNLELIKYLHVQRLRIEEKIDNLDHFLDLPDYVKDLVSQWSENQFKLQEAWGFPPNAKYHRFWTLTGCKCPKLDNEDRYPIGNYVINGACPLHGSDYE